MNTAHADPILSWTPWASSSVVNTDGSRRRTACTVASARFSALPIETATAAEDVLLLTSDSPLKPGAQAVGTATRRSDARAVHPIGGGSMFPAPVARLADLERPPVTCGDLALWLALQLVAAMLFSNVTGRAPSYLPPAPAAVLGPPVGTTRDPLSRARQLTQVARCLEIAPRASGEASFPDQGAIVTTNCVS